MTNIPSRHAVPNLVETGKGRKTFPFASSFALVYIINHGFLRLLLFFARAVIVPTLPDFSRHRVGHKQYQSKYHHDRHFGPFFEEPQNDTGTLQVGFHQGTESILNCRVGMLKDKTVIISPKTSAGPDDLFRFPAPRAGYVGEENRG